MGKRTVLFDEGESKEGGMRKWNWILKKKKKRRRRKKEKGV